MIKKSIFLLSFATATLFATPSSYDPTNQEFLKYKQSQEDAFANYKKEQEEAYKNYKKELGVYWEKPEVSSKKKIVSYSEDKKSKTLIDFEKDKVKIEVIASSKKEAEQKIKLALAKAITVDTKTFVKTDPLEKKLSKIQKPTNVVDSRVNAVPILSTVVFKKPPTKKSVYTYVTKKVQRQNISTKKSKLKNKKVYTLNVNLPKGATYKRSKLYYDDVRKNAQKQNLPLSLVYAIMHSESSFNPLARSHVPAYGLMQIVPKTAGIDSYFFLYKQKKLVSSHYLYNAQNNIKMGSAYLHILYYSYLKKIKNPQSRLYCTIAAYNTGAGNIAWAFTRQYNMTRAAKEINKLTPQQVYDHLLKNLRFDEPKHYLVKVNKRMKIYKKIYG